MAEQTNPLSHNAPHSSALVSYEAEGAGEERRPRRETGVLMSGVIPLWLFFTKG